MRIARRILWVVLVAALIGTALPYFGFFNEAVFWGPFPEPLALMLICNLVLTLCVIAIYPLYFKPLARELQRSPVEEIK